MYIRSRKFPFPFFFYELMIKFLVDFSLVSIFKGKGEFFQNSFQFLGSL